MGFDEIYIHIDSEIKRFTEQIEKIKNQISSERNEKLLQQGKDEITKITKEIEGLQKDREKVDFLVKRVKRVDEVKEGIELLTKDKKQIEEEINKYSTRNYQEEPKDLKKLKIEWEKIKIELDRKKEENDRAEEILKEVEKEKLELMKKYKIKEKDPAGKDPKGKDPVGKDPKGKDPKGKDPKGKDPKGKDPKGKDPAGKDPAGKDPKGKDPKGKTPNSNLPVRSFWEIYDETCTEHCGTIAAKIHGLAHMKLRTEGDTVQKVLGFLPMLGKAVIKGPAFLLNKALGTDRKYEALRQNVESLSTEEFEVLTEGAEIAEKKDARDTDYLNPTFMKQNKVNDLYLNAVYERYKRQRSEEIARKNEIISALDQSISVVYDRGVNSLTKEQQERYNELRNIGPSYLTLEETDELYSLQNEIVKSMNDEDKRYLNELGILREINISEGNEASHKERLFFEGMRAKSSARRNIKGWILGKFNPDNREFNHRMAELSKKRREAMQKGDQTMVTNLSRQMTNEQLASTYIKQVGKNQHNKIDKGDTSIDSGSPCELLDAGEQNKGRLLLTNLALGTAILRTYEILHNNAVINAQKAEIARGNAENSNIPYHETRTVASEGDISAAAQEYANTKISGAHGIGEYAHLDKISGKRDWPSGLGTNEYRAGDDALHAFTSNAAERVGQTTSSIEVARIGADTWNKVVERAKSVQEQYAGRHTNYDYTGYLQSLSSSNNGNAMINLLERLGDGTVNVSGTVRGTAIKDLLDNLSLKADYATLATLGAVTAALPKRTNPQTRTTIKKPTERANDPEKTTEQAKEPIATEPIKILTKKEMPATTVLKGDER